MSRFSVLAAMVVLAMSVFAHAAPDPNAPEGLDGFSGAITGTVTTVANKRDKNVRLEISAIDPSVEGVVGKTFKAGPNQIQKDGKYPPDPDHVAYFASLKQGDTVTLSVKWNTKQGRFVLQQVPAAN